MPMTPSASAVLDRFVFSADDGFLEFSIIPPICEREIQFLFRFNKTTNLIRENNIFGISERLCLLYE